MTETIKIPFVNKGEPFELPKLPVGGSLALARYRADHPDYTKDEVKSRLFDDQQIEQMKILLAWTLKNKFENETVDDLMTKIDTHLTLNELVDVGMKILKLNFPDAPVRDRPKDAEEKK